MYICCYFSHVPHRLHGDFDFPDRWKVSFTVELSEKGHFRASKVDGFGFREKSVRVGWKSGGWLILQGNPNGEMLSIHDIDEPGEW